MEVRCRCGHCGEDVIFMIGEEEAVCEECGSDFTVNYIPLAYGDGNHFAVEIEPYEPIEAVEDEEPGVSLQDYIKLKERLRAYVKRSYVVAIEDAAARIGKSIDFTIDLAEDIEDVTINVGIRSNVGYAGLPRSQWSLEYLGDI